MKRPQAPCLGCGERRPSCWDSCSKYKQFKEDAEIYKQNVKNGKRAEQDWGRVIFKSRYKGLL